MASTLHVAEVVVLIVFVLTLLELGNPLDHKVQGMCGLWLPVSWLVCLLGVLEHRGPEAPSGIDPNATLLLAIVVWLLTVDVNVTAKGLLGRRLLDIVELNPHFVKRSPVDHLQVPIHGVLGGLRYYVCVVHWCLWWNLGIKLFRLGLLVLLLFGCVTHTGLSEPSAWWLF